MPPSPRAALAAFARRLALGAFVAGACDGALVVAVAVAGSLLMLRVLGRPLPPSPSWAVLAVAPLAVGWLRQRRERVAEAVLAQHLDRRLQLGGLLVSAVDGVELEPAWQRRLAGELAALPNALPRVRWRALLVRPAIALLLAAAVVAWPLPTRPGGQTFGQAAQSTVERLAEALQRLEETTSLPPEVQQELQQQLARLQQQLAAGDDDAWRAADELAQRLEREQQLADAAAAGGEAGGALDVEALLGAAKLLQSLGGLDAVPPALRDRLQQALQDYANGKTDLGALAGDRAALQRLAQALAASGEQLAQRAGIGRQQLQDLQRLLQASGVGRHTVVRPGDGKAQPGPGQGLQAGAGVGSSGQGNAPGVGDGSGDDGNGGVGRGPGFAALNLTEDAQGLAEDAFVLPPGSAVPDQWVPIGERRQSPDAAPQPNTAAGSAGATGRGGAAWQLELAPRHRAAVQRFFQAGGATGDPGRK